MVLIWFLIFGLGLLYDGLTHGWFKESSKA